MFNRDSMRKAVTTDNVTYEFNHRPYTCAVSSVKEDADARRVIMVISSQYENIYEGDAQIETSINGHLNVLEKLTGVRPCSNS
jgi:hypothetical protein